MPFPESPRVAYRKNPLREVACELRFPDNLEISNSKPVEFQKHIKAEFPFYHEEKANVVVQGGVPVPNKIIEALVARIGADSPTRYRFTSSDGQSVLVLGQNQLILKVGAYPSWLSFKEKLEVVGEALRAVYPAPFYTRSGVRYINVIDPELLGIRGVSWNKLLKTSLLGLIGGLDGVIARSSKTEIQFDLQLPSLPGGRAVIRHGLTGKNGDGNTCYLIDMDLYTRERSQDEDVFGRLELLSREAGKLFRFVIRDELVKALEPLPLNE